MNYEAQLQTCKPPVPANIRSDSGQPLSKTRDARGAKGDKSRGLWVGRRTYYVCMTLFILLSSHAIL